MSKIRTLHGYAQRVRCAVGHSGETRLVRAQRWSRWWQCQGCSSWYQSEYVSVAQRGPVRGEHGQGGLRTVREEASR
jgi:hypothetical protein